MRQAISDKHQAEGRLVQTSRMTEPQTE